MGRPSSTHRRDKGLPFSSSFPRRWTPVCEAAGVVWAPPWKRWSCWSSPRQSEVQVWQRHPPRLLERESLSTRTLLERRALRSRPPAVEKLSSWLSSVVLSSALFASPADPHPVGGAEGDERAREGQGAAPAEYPRRRHCLWIVENYEEPTHQPAVETCGSGGRRWQDINQG